jgi:hypothetical protein
MQGRTNSPIPLGRAPEFKRIVEFVDLGQLDMPSSEVVNGIRCGKEMIDSHRD